MIGPSNPLTVLSHTPLCVVPCIGLKCVLLLSLVSCPLRPPDCPPARHMALAMDLVLQASQCTRAVHEAGLLHLDIKATNFLVKSNTKTEEEGEGEGNSGTKKAANGFEVKVCAEGKRGKAWRLRSLCYMRGNLLSYSSVHSTCCAWAHDPPFSQKTHIPFSARLAMQSSLSLPPLCVLRLLTLA
jgi:hypothetical protein